MSVLGHGRKGAGRRDRARHGTATRTRRGYRAGEEGEGVQLDRELTSNALEGTAMAGEAGRHLDGARTAAAGGGEVRDGGVDSCEPASIPSG